jgi:hypothetical protein
MSEEKKRIIKEKKKRILELLALKKKLLKERE